MQVDEAPPLPRFIELQEAMRLTTLGRSAIYNYIDCGELRRIKLGKKVVFLEQDLRNFIERKVAEARQSEPAEAA